jgi:ABC-2 type transport system ATP-binding protein
LTIVEFSGVSKRFGTRIALRDVSFSLPAGSALGLLGPNGAGKTTALRLILGFTRPTKGSLLLRGRSPEDPSARSGVAYLPERLHLPARMSVHAFLRLHGILAGVDAASIAGEVEAVLALTGLEGRADDRIGDLSKGLCQRVGFAQAFLGSPDFLVLDEPTSGLDPIGVRDARDWIKAARSRGCSVLMSSHILSEVERVCDRIAIVNEGGIAAEGSADELVEPGESLEDAFIRVVQRS